MSPDEKRLAREMHLDRKMVPSAVAKTLGRDLSCICRFFGTEENPEAVGQPRKFIEAMIGKTTGSLGGDGGRR